MPTIELLTPQAHGRLRLRLPTTTDSHFVAIVASEFTAAAACCPILFTKDSGTGAFYAGAMFGFRPGEVLLDTAARGGFEPLMFQREGFFMSDRNLAIDRDHERFSDRDGEPLFDETGAPAKSLRAIQRAMGEASAGLQQTHEFIAAMTELKLIEPIDISLTFGAERMSLQGLYTVSLDRLRDVDDAAALRLFRAGHLQLVHVMSASLKQIGRLATLRSLRA
jgi:hypothetical protein